MVSHNPTKVIKSITVDSEHEGQRIDNFLFTKLKGIPKSHIYRILRKGLIRVNKKRVKPDYRLCEEDFIRLPTLMHEDTQAPKVPTVQQIKFLESHILYEDDLLIVINKPSGVAVHGGSGLSFGVIEVMRHARPLVKSLELVHRLDRDTSGCLLLAKKRAVLKELHEQLREHQVEKIYLTLVKGYWRGGEKRVDASLEKNLLQSGERMVKISAEGKPSVTYFSPEKVTPQASLLKVKLETGRTHQIRVHARHVGFPIAGDDKYGDEQFNQAMKKMGLKRLFLHASSLSFKLSVYDKPMHVIAPLGEELVAVLNKLDK